MAEDKKEVKKKYDVGMIATQHSPAIIKDGEAMAMEEAIAEILNKLDKIEKSVA